MNQAQRVALPWSRSRRYTVAALALLLVSVTLLAGCSVETPGLPHVWPGQSINPNIQTRTGDVIELTLRATNDAGNSDHGGANQVRTITALPPGVEVIGFASSDDMVLPAGDINHTWLEQIDTKNRVVTVGFNQVDSGAPKTATLRLHVTAASGANLTFRTMLTWANASPDTLECDVKCAAGGLRLAVADDPQLSAYVNEHADEIQAFMETYPGGGGATANVVSIAVGDTILHSSFPLAALLTNTHDPDGATFTTQEIFTPDEPVMLWYNRADGSATFLFRTNAFTTGGIRCGLSEEQWQALPADTTSIVAHGQFSQVEAVYLFNRTR